MTRIVVVTGAGGGRATTEEFANVGYDVALLSCDEAWLVRAAKTLDGKYGVRALPIPKDMISRLQATMLML